MNPKNFHGLHSMFQRRSSFKSFRMLIFCIVLAGSPAPVLAQDASQMVADAWMNVASAMTTMVYAPVKVGYAGLGTFVAGVTWVVTRDEDAVDTVLFPTVGGTYVLTADHLIGKKDIQFFGESLEDTDSTYDE